MCFDGKNLCRQTKDSSFSIIPNFRRVFFQMFVSEPLLYQFRNEDLVGVPSDVTLSGQCV